MARAIFSHEVIDPDFQWLLSNYAERKGAAMTVDISCLPVVLVLLTEEERAKAGTLVEPLPPIPLPQESESDSSRDEPPSE
jgi:hypothetical protein